jgi:transketolase
MRLDGTGKKVYCLMGDGEIAEGQIWEAAMASVNFRLDNVVGIVDKNKMQATGFVSDRFATDPLSDKWRGFGWHVIEADGHDAGELIEAFNEAGGIKGKPAVIIADTVKGKGISFAENVAAFHNGMLSPEQYDIAIAELDAQIAGLI